MICVCTSVLDKLRMLLYEDKFDQLVAARLKRDKRGLIWLKPGASSAQLKGRTLD